MQANNQINNQCSSSLPYGYALNMQSEKIPIPAHMSLPIWKKYDDILNLVKHNSVTVVKSPCGSGKTTQIPQMLNLSQIVDGKIIVVENRVVIATELAERVAGEMGENVGNSVGFITGLEKDWKDDSKILFVTAGVYVQIIKNNPTLQGIGIVIFDEFDDRELYMDVGAAMTHYAINHGSKAKMLFMSGTIEPYQLEHVYGAKSLEVKGAEYPVKVNYNDYNVGIWGIADWCANKALSIVSSNKTGDILIFMPGKGEITQVINKIKTGLAGTTHDIDILPLHSELSPEEKKLPFKNTGKRKIIVATNMAQRGVTFDGIKYVISSGLERRVEYDKRINAKQLLLLPVSQTDIIQQIGRAGRTAPGDSFLPFTEDDFYTLADVSSPEILRLPLEDVVMHVSALGIGTEHRALRFLDSPHRIQWDWAVNVLSQMGILDPKTERLTPYGEMVNSFCCGAREGAIIARGACLGVVKEAILVAAMRMCKSFYELPSDLEYEECSITEKREIANNARADIPQSSQSDLLADCDVYYEALKHLNDDEWFKSHYIVKEIVENVRGYYQKLIMRADRMGIDISERKGTFVYRNFSDALKAGFLDMIYILANIPNENGNKGRRGRRITPRELSRGAVYINPFNNDKIVLTDGCHLCAQNNATGLYPAILVTERLNTGGVKSFALKASCLVVSDKELQELRDILNYNIDKLRSRRLLDRARDCRKKMTHKELRERARGKKRR